MNEHKDIITDFASVRTYSLSWLEFAIEQFKKQSHEIQAVYGNLTMHEFITKYARKELCESIKLTNIEPFITQEEIDELIRTAKSTNTQHVVSEGMQKLRNQMNQVIKNKQSQELLFTKNNIMHCKFCVEFMPLFKNCKFTDEAMFQLAQSLENKPIIMNEKVIGIMNKPSGIPLTVNPNKDGFSIVMEGIIWCSIEPEIIVDESHLDDYLTIIDKCRITGINISGYKGYTSL